MTGPVTTKTGGSEAVAASAEQNPAPAAAPLPPTPDPKIAIPSPITGAFLFCISENNVDSKATSASILCNAKHKTDASLINLSLDSKAHQWNAVSSTDLQVTWAELPPPSKYQVRYLLKANTPTDLQSFAGNMTMSLMTIDKTDIARMLSITSNVISPDAPDDSVVRLKNAPNVCLDLSGGFTTAGTDFLSYTCNGGDNQKAVLTEWGQITIKGVCLVVRPSDSQSVVAPCSDSLVPQFVVFGTTIRVANTELCLAGLNGITRIIKCDAHDPAQQWIVGKKVFPSATP
ncbi:MAG: ricin-type beta-trefoil lectin domain protein [Chitinophagaceae bacterium]|nr:ricin-type beta-trefoil lectin domain protein [Oligoflexus sp.]